MNFTYLLGLIVLALLIVLLFPFLLVASLNTLFPALAIPYTLGTWASALFLLIVFASRSNTVRQVRSKV